MAVININNDDIKAFNEKYSCNVDLCYNDNLILDTSLLEIFNNVYIGDFSDKVIVFAICNITPIVKIDKIEDNIETLIINYSAKWSSSMVRNLNPLIGKIKIPSKDFGIILMDQINNSKYTFRGTVLEKMIEDDIMTKINENKRFIIVQKNGEVNKDLRLVFFCNGNEDGLDFDEDTIKKHVAFISDSFSVENSFEFAIYGESVSDKSLKSQSNRLYIVDKDNNYLARASVCNAKLEKVSSIIKVSFCFDTSIDELSPEEDYNKNIKPFVDEFSSPSGDKEDIYNDMFGW